MATQGRGAYPMQSAWLLSPFQLVDGRAFGDAPEAGPYVFRDWIGWSPSASPVVGSVGVGHILGSPIIVQRGALL